MEYEKKEYINTNCMQDIHVLYIAWELFCMFGSKRNNVIIYLQLRSEIYIAECTSY